MGADDQSQPLSPQAVMAVIQCIVEEGNLIPSQHIKQRMRERDFVMSDVFNVLECGQVK